MRSGGCAILVVMLVVILAGATFGAEFRVSTAAELHTVLEQAEANGENDVITLISGIYRGNFVYEARDGNALMLQSADGIGPEEVILDGDGNGAVITIVSVTRGAVVTLADVSVQSGSSTNTSGGGIRIIANGGTLRVRLQNVIIQHNATNYTGGGIGLKSYNDTAVALEIRDSIIRYNTAIGADIGRGGGVYAYAYNGNSSIDVLIVNSLIYGNRASSSGGGVELAASEVGDNNIVRATIVNTTITGNVSNLNRRGDYRGGGIWACSYRGNGANVELNLYNSIVWGNESVGSDGGQDLFIRSNDPGTITVHAYNCDIGDVLVDESSGRPIYTHARVIGTDPLFLDPHGGDFRLGDGSPCIDAGTSDLPLEIGTVDLAGNSRECGLAPDLGPYEHCGKRG